MVSPDYRASRSPRCHRVGYGCLPDGAQVTGAEAEMELPFAGIHQLCAPYSTSSMCFRSRSRPVTTS